VEIYKSFAKLWWIAGWLAWQIWQFDSAEPFKSPPNGFGRIGRVIPIGKGPAQYFTSFLLHGPAVVGGANPEPRFDGVV